MTAGAKGLSELKMGILIGGPLVAAAEASARLAQSTADVIQAVGFDEAGRARKAETADDKPAADDVPRQK